jgi:hypothetical protein
MAFGGFRGRCCVPLLLAVGLWSPAGLAAQTQEGAALAEEEEEEEPASLRPRLDFGLEAKANFRESGSNRFPVVLPPGFVPPGQTEAFEETVSAGSHFELSAVTLLADAVWGDGLAAHAKIDLIDLYDRNPTSTDKKVDVDEAWIRFGVEPEPAELAARGGVYLKLGKFPKFERQDDRHLESYGLVSTAFNRFEDAGAELGVNLGRHVYLKVSATQGNPVFIRDPNALAGDNGTPERQRLPPGVNTAFQSGIVILYDAEIEDVDVDGDLETGAGVGFRLADEAGRHGLDVLAWGYRRKLAQTVALEGTFYGGDIDVLNGPFDVDPALPIAGDDKEEVGANLWLYYGGLSLFGQYVDQELAGLPRTGIEAEAAWRFELPLLWAVGGRQLFPWIAPAVRYSKLDNDFGNERPTSAPSLAWDWEKIDAGLRLGVFSGIDLTVEYADNRFILGSGAERENNEFLSTLRWRI